MDAESAARLLAHLRSVAGDGDARYAEVPTPLAGGYETRTYALRLATQRNAWARPLVVRVLPASADATWLEREHAVLRWLAACAFPAPAVLAACADAGLVGGPFLVMEPPPRPHLPRHPLPP